MSIGSQPDLVTSFDNFVDKFITEDKVKTRFTNAKSLIHPEGLDKDKVRNKIKDNLKTIVEIFSVLKTANPNEDQLAALRNFKQAIDKEIDSEITHETAKVDKGDKGKIILFKTEKEITQTTSQRIANLNWVKDEL